MKIEIGVDELSGRTFAELKRISDSVNKSVPGMPKHLRIEDDMPESLALTIIAQQFGELLLSHANLELAFAKLELHAMRVEDTIKIMHEEHEILSKSYDQTCGILDKIVIDLTVTPDTHKDLLDSAMDTMVEYAYDSGNAGLSTTYTFKEGDLRRALTDAMHSFNMKVVNR